MGTADVATTGTAGRLSPDWLLRGEVGLCPCGCIGKRRKGGFVAKTLRGASGLVRQAMFSDDVAATPGLLQRLDARVKVLTLLGLLVAAAFVHSIPALAAMYVVALALASASRLSLGSSSRGCGCSSRSSPGSSCCRPRSTSSRRARSSSRSAPGSAARSG